MFDYISLTRYLAATGVLIALLIAFAVVLLLVKRRYATGAFTPQKRRLKVVETLPLSARHKIMIIQQDDLEHTVLIGGTADIHIGTGPAQTNAIGQDDGGMIIPTKNPIGFLKNFPQPAKTKASPKAKNNKKKTS